ncbi:membrane protein BRI3-like [Oculina patagonica]
MSAPPPYAPVNTGPQGYQQGYQQGPPPVTTAPGTGYPPSYQSGAPPGYQPIPTQPAPTTYVYVQGNCPACHTGTLQDEFTGLGICLAIFFFPLGLVCCLLLTEKRCTRCGMRYS